LILQAGQSDAGATLAGADAGGVCSRGPAAAARAGDVVYADLKAASPDAGGRRFAKYHARVVNVVGRTRDEVRGINSTSCKR